jgi:hypothetical protein
MPEVCEGKNQMKTLYKIREGWLHDVGYVRLASDLCLDPDMIKSLYDKWTAENMKKGWSYP